MMRLSEVVAEMWRQLRATDQAQQISIDDVTVCLERRDGMYVLTLRREAQRPTAKRIKLYRMLFGVPSTARQENYIADNGLFYVYTHVWKWEAL